MSTAKRTFSMAASVVLTLRVKTLDQIQRHFRGLWNLPNVLTRSVRTTLVARKQITRSDVRTTVAPTAHFCCSPANSITVDSYLHRSLTDEDCDMTQLADRNLLFGILALED